MNQSRASSASGMTEKQAWWLGEHYLLKLQATLVIQSRNIYWKTTMSEDHTRWEGCNSEQGRRKYWLPRVCKLLKKAKKQFKYRVIKWLQEGVLHTHWKSARKGTSEEVWKRFNEMTCKWDRKSWCYKGRVDVTKEECLDKEKRDGKVQRGDCVEHLGKLFCSWDGGKRWGWGKDRTLWIWLLMFQSVEQMSCLLKALYTTDLVRTQNSLES